MPLTLQARRDWLDRVRRYALDRYGVEFQRALHERIVVALANDALPPQTPREWVDAQWQAQLDGKHTDRGFHEQNRER